MYEYKWMYVYVQFVSGETFFHVFDLNPVVISRQHKSSILGLRLVMDYTSNGWKYRIPETKTLTPGLHCDIGREKWGKWH